jgi:anti-anti-sigma factor
VEVRFSIQDGDPDGRAFILELRGELDSDTVETVSRRVRLMPLDSLVVLDLRHVTYIDSSGVRLIAESKQQRGDLLRVRGAGPALAHVFKQAGAQALLDS